MQAKSHARSGNSHQLLRAATGSATAIPAANANATPSPAEACRAWADGGAPRWTVTPARYPPLGGLRAAPALLEAAVFIAC